MSASYHLILKIRINYFVFIVAILNAVGSAAHIWFSSELSF